MIMPAWPFQRIPYWAYALLLLVIVVMTFYIIARLQIAVDGAGSKFENGQCVVTAVKPGSPADKSGLQPGDIIEYIGSLPVKKTGYTGLLEPYTSGDTVPYKIVRDHEELTLMVTFDSFWSLNSWFYTSMYSLILLVSITSIFILYRKPNDLTAHIFFIFLQLLAIAQNFRILYLDNPYALFATISFIYSFNIFGVVLFHFYLVFPKPAPVYNKYRDYLKVIYLTGFLFATIEAILLTRRIYTGAEEAAYSFHVFNRLSIAWMGLTLCAALVVAVYQLFITRKLKEKKQLRLVVIGSAFGLATPILFSIYPDYIWKMEREQHLLTMVEITYGAGTYIMTSFLAIAIFRYRIWNIEPFIRKAISYVFATLLIYVIYFLSVFLVDKLIIHTTNVIHFFTLAGSISIFLLLKDPMKRLIDRFFRREVYDSAKAIAGFEEKTAGIYQINELLTAITMNLYEIFHFKSFAFFLKMNNNLYKPIYLLGIDKCIIDKELEITPELDLLLRKSNVFSAEDLRSKPKIIDFSIAELIVPLVIGSQSFGFFVVGPKRSEWSYTLQDIHMLQLLARRVVSLFHTAGLYQKDLDRQLMLERERTRIAKDMHDDVGASLTRISLLSALAKENVADSPAAKKWLQQIFDISRDVMQGMNQIIWALNTQNDTLEGLVAYIRRFAIEFLEPCPVKCVFHVPENFPGMNLRVEVRRNLYLIVREALNNIVKHAKANEVEISMAASQDNLEIIIRDNGVGFDPGNLNFQGNGLLNMKKRIHDIGGEFKLNSKSGEGTEILVVLLLSAVE
jgi:signal transduction histidine kinase